MVYCIYFNFLLFWHSLLHLYILLYEIQEIIFFQVGWLHGFVYLHGKERVGSVINFVLICFGFILFSLSLRRKNFLKREEEK